MPFASLFQLRKSDSRNWNFSQDCLNNLTSSNPLIWCSGFRMILCAIASSATVLMSSGVTKSRHGSSCCVMSSEVPENHEATNLREHEGPHGFCLRFQPCTYVVLVDIDVFTCLLHCDNSLWVGNNVDIDCILSTVNTSSKDFVFVCTVW